MAGREILVSRDRTQDPVQNLAREDELFQRIDGADLPEFVRFWVNSECLVKGRARSGKYGWYNEGLAESMGIQVVERSTGGGVVYHDLGNLNWSFFFRTSGIFLSPEAAFHQASKFVVKALRSIGVPAQFCPPNRIDVAGRKVSGMAARSTVRTLLVHGTLLLNSDLDKLNALCMPPPTSPPVSNLCEWVPKIDAKSIVEAMTGSLRDSGFDVKPTHPWPYTPPVSSSVGSPLQ